MGIVAGAPRIWFGGFFNFAYRAPHVVGIDIEDELSFWSDPPALTGETRFVFLPERADGLEEVIRRYPGGTLTTASASNDQPLYVQYAVGP